MRRKIHRLLRMTDDSSLRLLACASDRSNLPVGIACHSDTLTGTGRSAAVCLFFIFPGRKQKCNGIDEERGRYVTLISLAALASFAFGTQAAPRGSLFWNTGFACIACGTQAFPGSFDLPSGEGARRADEGLFIICRRAVCAFQAATSATIAACIESIRRTGEASWNEHQPSKRAFIKDASPLLLTITNRSTTYEKAPLRSRCA